MLWLFQSSSNISSFSYANSPVRDLTKIEMRCNVMGEIPSPRTIVVKPNDVVTYVSPLILLAVYDLTGMVTGLNGTTITGLLQMTLSTLLTRVRESYTFPPTHLSAIAL